MKMCNCVSLSVPLGDVEGLLDGFDGGGSILGVIACVFLVPAFLTFFSDEDDGVGVKCGSLFVLLVHPAQNCATLTIVTKGRNR